MTINIPWWVVSACAFVLLSCGITWGFSDNWLSCYHGGGMLLYPWGLVIGVGCIAANLVTVVHAIGKTTP